MAQIIIEIVGDASKLRPTIEELEKIGTLTKDQAEAFKKFNTESSRTAGATANSAKGAAKSFLDVEKNALRFAEMIETEFKAGMMEALEEAGVSLEEFQAAIQSAVGSAKTGTNENKKFGKETEQLGGSYEDISDKLEGFVKSQAKLEDQLKSTQDELDELRAAYDKLTNSGNSNTKSSESLKKELARINAELITLRSRGEENTKQYSDLNKRAAELKKTIKDVGEEIARTGSDTRALDSVIELLGGITGGYAVAQGAAALFGVENEELQKSLLKVNAAMAILQGLQQIQAVVTKGQFQSLATLIGVQRVNALQTNLQTAAESKNIIVRNLAIVAQRALNFVMAASPLGVAAVLIGAVAGAWALFSSNAKSAKEIQEELNKAIESANFLLDLNLDTIQQRTDRRIAQLQKEGRVESEISKERIRGLNDEVEARYKALNAAADAYNQALDSDIDNDAFKTISDNYQTLLSAFNNAVNQQKVAAINLDKQLNDEALRSARAYAEGRVLITKAGTREELDARIDAIKAARAQEIANSLTEGEKYRIQIQTIKDIAELRNQYEILVLKRAQQAVEARAISAKEGSKEELDYRLEALDLGYQSEIQDKNKSTSELLLIDAKYLKDRNEMIKQYNLKVAQEAINSRLSELNTALQSFQGIGVSDNNKELVRLQKAALDEQMQLEILSAQATINNEELLAKKIAEIRASTAAQKIAIDQAAATYTIDTNKAIENSELELKKKRIELLLNDPTLSPAGRRQLSKQIHQITLDQIQAEEDALEEKHFKGLVKEEEYQQALLDIAMRRIEAEMMAEQQKEARRQEIINASFEVIEAAFSAIVESQAAERQAETDRALAEIAEQRQRELENKNLTEQQKAEIDKRYRLKESQVKRQAWIADRNAKATEAIVQGALNVIKAFPDPIRMALATLLTGITVSKIRSQPVPQFAKGTKKAPKGYAWVGEEGPELIYLKGGERIWSYRESMDMAAAWRGGSTAKMDRSFRANVARADDSLSSYMKVSNSGGLEIDYNEMGKAVASHLPEPNLVQNNMDADGFTSYVIKAGNRTQVRNKRYRL